MVRLRRIKKQDGIVLPLVAVFLIVLILLAALSTEAGTRILTSERLQVAVDAAALAGALNGQPWLEVAVDRSHKECSYTRDLKGNILTHCWWQYDTVTLSGQESVLVKSWAAQAGCGAGWRCAAHPRVLRRWVVFPADTVRVAQSAFWADAPARSGLSIAAPEIQVGGDGTVQVRASAVLQTHLLRLAGVQTFRLARTGQAMAGLRAVDW